MSFNLRPGTSLFGNVTFTPGTNENYVAPPVHGTISTTSLTDQYYIVGAYQDDDADTDSGSVFVYDATDLSAPPTQLLHPNPVYGNKFGSALASNSNKFVIVSYGDNNYQGSIFVYDKNDLSAVPVQLTTPDAANYDFFASSDIAMSETHILAGSIGDDDGGATSSGSAYLWNLSDLSAPPTKLRPSNLIAYSKFGMNVALSDSYAIISAKGGNADTGNTDAGSGSHQDPGGIYIYDLSDLSAAPIELMAPEQGDVVGSSFGAGQGSISILGNTLVVGASTLLVDGDSRAGKVYIYDMSDLSAAPTELTEPSSGYWSLFGRAVDVTETHIAVGAPRSRSGSPNSKDSGAVYIYDRSDLSASPIQLLGDDLESTSGQRPLFGQSIDLTDTTVIVGAPNETVDGGNLSGAIYIWDLSDLTANSTRIISPNPAAGDGFAYSIEILTTETTTSSESESGSDSTPEPEPEPYIDPVWPVLLDRAVYNSTEGTGSGTLTFGDWTYGSIFDNGQGTRHPIGTVTDQGLRIQAPYWSGGDWWIEPDTSGKVQVEIIGRYDNFEGSYSRIDLFLTNGPVDSTDTPDLVIVPEGTQGSDTFMVYAYLNSNSRITIRTVNTINGVSTIEKVTLL